MSRYADYTFLKVEVRDSIAYVTIDNPEKMNACSHEDHGEFATILRDVAADDEVRAVVLTGAGRAFSVGATYEYMKQLTEDQAARDELQTQVRELVRSHIDLEKPVVAAVNGVATGSGLMLALLSDYVIVEENVKMADGHIKAAIAAGDGGVLIWPLAVGFTRAKRYLLTGDWIDAAEAERIGLVTELVPPGASLARATEVATEFAAMPEQAVRFTKRALNQWLSFGSSVGFELSASLEMQTFGLHGEQVRQAVDDLDQMARAKAAERRAKVADGEV
ncbi:MAG TPA: enoyl-CoA hydratase-related protein [Solirubrobacterales bacterium]|nr:enoyl-CoA hydratase-related protein [Solirubrobacterales bacterium]